MSYFRGAVHVAGWVADPVHRVKRIEAVLPGRSPVPVDGYGQPSPDVAAAHGPWAGACRFRFSLAEDDPVRARDLRLLAHFKNGATVELTDLVRPALDADPYQQLFQRFFDLLKEEKNEKGTVLEIGARARSGHVRRELVAPLEYVGFDIVEGENTDVVGDAHGLTDYFPEGSFDAIFAISTFEHLAMPWKVVLEMNRVLTPGGLVFVSSHQTFPLHDTPWDAWRFSDSAWHALFNPATGFEVIDTALGERAGVVANLLHPVTTTLEQQPPSSARRSWRERRDRLASPGMSTRRP